MFVLPDAEKCKELYDEWPHAPGEKDGKKGYAMSDEKVYCDWCGNPTNDEIICHHARHVLGEVRRGVNPFHHIDACGRKLCGLCAVTVELEKPIAVVCCPEHAREAILTKHREIARKKYELSLLEVRAQGAFVRCKGRAEER